jgi:hypothetical protein
MNNTMPELSYETKYIDLLERYNKLDVTYEKRYIDLLRVHTKLKEDYDRLHNYIIFLNNKRDDANNKQKPFTR